MPVGAAIGPGGARRIECPLRLHVWGFALPVTPSSATAFGLTHGDIARRHGVAVDSPDGRRLYTRYYEMLLDHKISTYVDSQSRARTYLAARHDLGESLWWYVCCGPGAPHNNFFVDMSAMTHRLLFWQQKRENVEGLLYWDTTWWNPLALEKVRRELGDLLEKKNPPAKAAP